jgi:NADPH:quinone reductase-like Zn-dependent oxidoreductase
MEQIFRMANLFSVGTQCVSVTSSAILTELLSHSKAIWKAAEGAVAEYIKVPAERLVRKPDNLPPTEVAGTCLVGLTAYQGLIRVAELQEGQSVFINGGSSSVGRFALQIAKAKGCRVTVSCSGSKIQSMKGLGADEVGISISAPSIFPVLILPLNYSGRGLHKSSSSPTA